MWTHLTYGAMLTHNQDGSAKPSPRIWTPARSRFSIPDRLASHGRPVLRLHNAPDAVPLTLVFFPDVIGGLSAAGPRTLVALGDAPTAPGYWAHDPA